MWHGILVDQAFADRSYPDRFEHFARETFLTSGWQIHGIVVPDDRLESAILKIQAAMRSDEVFYSHLYNDRDLIVLFKKELFRVGNHEATWRPVLEFGRQLGMPEEQLDFWPNRFQDEKHYFKPESFLIVKK